MERNIDLLDRELTFEEFEQLAANIPKRPVASIFMLVEIDVWSDLKEKSSLYPEFSISRCCKGFYSSLSSAETAMRAFIFKRDYLIYCFKIYEFPLDSVSDLGSLTNLMNIREYLYDPEGRMLEHTVCSSLIDDVHTEYGHYLGKPKSKHRFKKGDIVEVLESDRVHLAIVSHEPIDTHWCFDYYCRIKKETECGRYMLDYSDDQVAVVDGPEYGNHSHKQLCDIITPSFPISEELRKLYEGYLVASQI